MLNGGGPFLSFEAAPEARDNLRKGGGPDDGGTWNSHMWGVLYSRLQCCAGGLSGDVSVLWMVFRKEVWTMVVG